MVLAEEYLMKITKIKNSSSPGMIVEFYCDLKACYLAECSPIIKQNSSNPSSRKNLDVRPYDRTWYYF